MALNPFDPNKPLVQQPPEPYAAASKPVATTAGQTTAVTPAAQPAMPSQRVRQVKPEETVAGQMKGLLSQDNPYITQARTRAAQAANQRGLLNTSLGVQAGEEAAISQALPIASADAQTYRMGLAHDLDVELTNLRQGHALEMEQAQQANILTRIDAEQANALERINVQHANTLAEIGLGQDNVLETLGIKHQQAAQLGMLDATRRLQELAIAEIGAIGRTQGLTADQQRAAIGDVSTRMGQAITYYQQLAGATPTWDANWATMPTAPVPAPPAFTGGTYVQPATVQPPAAVPVNQTYNAGPGRFDPYGIGVTSSCFLGDTRVEMADGTHKRIDQICIGDKVRGLYGYLNEVLALDQPKLGLRSMWSINGEMPTTDEHLFWGGADWGPLSLEHYLNHERGQPLEVIVDDAGNRAVWHYPAISLDQIAEKRVGDTIGYGRAGETRLIEYLVEQVGYPPETPIYSLVLGGSHTMLLNGGYVFSGWARDDDFDYQRGRPRGKQAA
jgi:hypothetical protein